MNSTLLALSLLLWPIAFIGCALFMRSKHYGNVLRRKAGGKTLKQFLEEQSDARFHISGGFGVGIGDAIVIDLDDEVEGVTHAYDIVDQMMGALRVPYQLKGQLLRRKKNKYYDVFYIGTGGKGSAFYFDITQFWKEGPDGASLQNIKPSH